MLSEYFDRIYVINLPHRTDRRKEMEAQFRRIGHESGDGKTIFFPAIRPSDAGDFPTIGARGCFMSHLEILRDIQKSDGVRHALILEDDCNFRKNINTVLDEARLAFDAIGQGLFYGGALNEVANIHEKTNSLRVVSSLSGIMGSHCIGIDNKTAGELVEYFEKILKRPAGDSAGGPMHVDGAYSWFRKDHPGIETWLAVPECVYQRSSATDVHPPNSLNKFVAIRWFVSKVRKIKNEIRRN